MRFQAPEMQPFEWDAFSDLRNQPQYPDCTGPLPSQPGYGTGGGGNSYSQVLAPNSRTSRTPKHWQELSSLGHIEEDPFGPQTETGTITLTSMDSECRRGAVQQNTCPERLDPILQEVLGAMRASKRGPVSPKPWGQSGFWEYSGLNSPV